MNLWRATPLASIALLASAPATAQEETRSCAPADLSALAGWNRVWAAEGMDAGLSGREGTPNYPLIGFGAPWNDQGWRRMAAMLRFGATERNKQQGWGFPMMMHSYAEVKFIIAPAETAIIGQYRENRYVYTDGRTHPPDEELWPTVWGDSIGCWEGDTLVVDTVGVKYDASHSPFSPPFSEQARFVEHIRMVAPDRIEAEMTVTDPVYLKQPWVTSYVLVPAGIDRLVHDAFEDRTLATESAVTIAPRKEADVLATVELPPDVKLSTADLDLVSGRYAIEGAPVEFFFERQGERLFFKVPPQLTFFVPLLAASPLAYNDPVGGSFNFQTDGSGNVTGFEGTSPEGAPIKALRVGP